MKVELQTKLKIDDKKEQDLLDFMYELSRSRSITNFATMAVKVCFEHPEYLTESGYIDAKQAWNMTKERQYFISEVEKAVSRLDKRITDLYKLIYELKYTLLLGNTLGVYERIDDSLLATLVIENQKQRLTELLGIQSMDSLVPNKTNRDVNINEEELIAKLVDNIMPALLRHKQSSLSATNEINQAQPNQTQEQPNQKQPKQEQPDKTHQNQNTEQPNQTQSDNNPEQSDQNQDADMADADWGALLAFIG